MFHSLSIKEVAKKLDTDLEKGLSRKEARKRVSFYGLNTLRKEKKSEISQIFIRIFDPVFLFLLILGGVFRLPLFFYFAFIYLILIVGFKSFSLILFNRARTQLDFKARVIREGKEQIINGKNLVPGDIIILFPGDKIPADGRIIWAENLVVQEEVLTGRAKLIPKNNKILPKGTILPERTNMAYAGSSVIFGTGKVLITATGRTTELGKLLRDYRVGIHRFWAQYFSQAISFSFLIFLCGFLILKLASFGAILSYSYLILTLPESFGFILSGIELIGIRSFTRLRLILQRRANLFFPSNIQIICTNKTGTLTTGQFSVTDIFTDNKLFKVSGKNFTGKGKFFLEGKTIDPKKQKNLSLLIKIGILCNDSKIKNSSILGNPTEGSLLFLGKKAGFDLEKLREEYPRIESIPFSPLRRWMAILFKEGNKPIIYIKGAPEKLLKLSKFILKAGRKSRFLRQEKKEIKKQIENLAQSGYRILAFAYKEISEENLQISTIEKGELVWVGFAAMADSIREGLPKIIKEAKKQGIRIIMITGDMASTAKIVGKELGLGEEVIEGWELDRLPSKKLLEKVLKVNIFSRCDPIQRLKIVSSLKRLGFKIATIGKNLDDIQALLISDLSIGLDTASELIKNSSDMILKDNNFLNLIKAIFVSKFLNLNLLKIVFYLFSLTLGEIFLWFLALLFNLRLPLSLVELGFLNLFLFPLASFGLVGDQTSPQKLAKVLESILLGLILALASFLLFLRFSYPIFKSFSLLGIFSVVLFSTDKRNFWLILSIVFSLIILGLWHL